MKLSDVVEHLIDKRGGKAVGEEINLDQSSISRFRSNDQGMKLIHIERLIDLAGYELKKKGAYRDLKKTIVTLGKLLDEEINV